MGPMILAWPLAWLIGCTPSGTTDPETDTADASTDTATDTGADRTSSALHDHILFVDPSELGQQLAVVPSDGGTIERIPNPMPGSVLYASVGPDGRLVVSMRASDQDGGDHVVWDLPSDGSDPSVLLDAASGATLSPDGRRLAYVDLSTNGPVELWVASASGQGAVRVTDAPGILESAPSWSPDGQQLAYAAYDSVAEDVTVRVVDVVGGEDRRLVDRPGLESAPAWSPDGTQIAYHSDEVRRIDLQPSGDWEIHVISVDGNDHSFVTNNTVGDQQPSWSPDGSQLAFVRRTGDGPDELVVADVVGSSERVIATSAFVTPWSTSWVH